MAQTINSDYNTYKLTASAIAGVCAVSAITLTVLSCLKILPFSSTNLDFGLTIGSLGAGAVTIGLSAYTYSTWNSLEVPKRKIVQIHPPPSLPDPQNFPMTKDAEHIISLLDRLLEDDFAEKGKEALRQLKAQIQNTPKYHADALFSLNRTNDLHKFYEDIKIAEENFPKTGHRSVDLRWTNFISYLEDAFVESPDGRKVELKPPYNVLPDYKIIKLDAADSVQFKKIQGIFDDCFTGGERTWDFQKYLFEKEEGIKKHVWVARARFSHVHQNPVYGEILGVAYVREHINRPPADMGKFHLCTLAVLPRAARLGVATRLFQVAINPLTKRENCTLNVREGNIAAKNLYTAQGFSKYKDNPGDQREYPNETAEIWARQPQAIASN